MKDADYVLMGGHCETWGWWQETSKFMSTHTFICENGHESNGDAFCKDLEMKLPTDGCPICSAEIVEVKDAH